MFSPLSKAIQSEYDKLMAAWANIPEPLRSQKIFEGVSPNDLMAYQIGWAKLLIGWYQAGLRGEMPVMPGEGFTKWDYKGLARHFYQKYAGQELEVQEIIQIVEKEYQTGNLDRTGVWDWCTLPSGKLWTLHKWIQVNTVSPYKRARILYAQISKKLM